MTTWIFPCNPTKYHIHEWFIDHDKVDWSIQSFRIHRGDFVYIYVSRVDRAICYKLLAVGDPKTSRDIEDDAYGTYPKTPGGKFVTLRLIEKLQHPISLEEIRNHGLSGNTMQGKIKMPAELLSYIEAKNRSGVSKHD